MRKAFALWTLILPVILLLPATAAPQIASPYDVMAERVFQGTVCGLPRITNGYLYFTILSEDDEIDVEAGPEAFLRERQFNPVPGDAVTVIGVPIDFKGQKTILLREMRNKGHRFAVRDHDGKPLWESEPPVQMDPELNDSGDPVC
jgi:hypothetical protein